MLRVRLLADLLVTTWTPQGHTGPLPKQGGYLQELLAVPLVLIQDFLARLQLTLPLVPTLQLIRVCAQQRDATSALAIYDWMRAPKATGGGGLQPTVFTYSEMLRATLAARLLDRGMQVRRVAYRGNLGQASDAVGITVEQEQTPRVLLFCAGASSQAGFGAGVGSNQISMRQGRGSWLRREKSKSQACGVNFHALARLLSIDD